MGDRSIIESIQAISGHRLSDRVYIASCNVESVNELKRTCLCTIIEGRVENEIEADLMAVVDDGFFIIPKIDSTVKVIFSEFVKPFVCQFSEIEKVVLIVGNSQVNVEDTVIEFNTGQLEGLVKLLPLIQKLNNLEQAYNDLVSKFNSHVHILTLTLGTGTAAPTVAPETTVLIQTQKSDLENPKIKQ